MRWAGQTLLVNLDKNSPEAVPTLHQIQTYLSEGTSVYTYSTRFE